MAPAATNGHRLAAAGDVFEGMVEVEIGPLDDFSQLVGFEDAMGGIGATREISVKRFAQGRATLEMKLAEPVELLRELEERCSVRVQGPRSALGPSDSRRRRVVGGASRGPWLSRTRVTSAGIVRARVADVAGANTTKYGDKLGGVV